MRVSDSQMSMQRRSRSESRIENDTDTNEYVVQTNPAVKWVPVAVIVALLVVAVVFSGTDQLTRAVQGSSQFIAASFAGKPAVPTKPAATFITAVEFQGSKLNIWEEPIPEDCYPEKHADYDGVAVKWGLGHKAESAAECCMKCKLFKPGPGGQPCNVWVWCGDPSGKCWTMDIHDHTTGDCWLKFQSGWDNKTDLATTNLKVNHRDKFSTEFRNEHKTAPVKVPWTAGLVVP